MRAFATALQCIRNSARCAHLPWCYQDQHGRRHACSWRWCAAALCIAACRLFLQGLLALLRGVCVAAVLFARYCMESCHQKLGLANTLDQARSDTAEGAVKAASGWCMCVCTCAVCSSVWRFVHTSTLAHIRAHECAPTHVVQAHTCCASPHMLCKPTRVVQVRTCCARPHAYVQAHARMCTLTLTHAATLHEATPGRTMDGARCCDIHVVCAPVAHLARRVDLPAWPGVQFMNGECLSSYMLALPAAGAST